MKFRSVIHKNGTITTEVAERGVRLTSSVFPLEETAAQKAPAAEVLAPPVPKNPERTPKGVSAATTADARVIGLLGALKRDRMLAPIVAAYERDATKPGRKFGKNGLKANGKLFALFTQGTLVVKLPKDRVAALVADGVGKPFDPGHGRLMKGWLTITSPAASWIDLAKEAHAFVKSARP